jgi:putative ABC transport system permease protein
MKVLAIATKSTLALTSLALTLSFCVALLCFLFVRTELSYDRSIPRSWDTFRVNLTINPPGSEPVTLPSITAQAGISLRSLGGIEDVTRLSLEDLSVTIEGSVRRLPAYVVDANFLTFFGLELVRGEMSLALAEPGSVVLDQNTAIELFGSADVMGRQIELAGSLLRITGVMAETIDNMHFEPTVLVSSTTPATRMGAADKGAHQGEFFAHTYLRIAENIDTASVAAAVASVPDSTPIMPPPQSEALMPQLSLLPVPDIHLNGLPAGELEAGGSRELIWAIAAVGSMILGTACLNLAILVGADADGRLREIGVRRAFGATRSHILGRFTARYALITGGCMFIALVVTGPFLPSVSQRLGLELVLRLPADFGVILAIPAAAVVAAVCALALSSSSSVNTAPSVALKGELVRKGSFWRAVAASVQFALSIMLISTTLIIGSQVSLAIDRSLSIGSDDVLIIDGLRPPFPAAAQRTLVEQAASISGVSSVGLSEIVPTDLSTTMVGLMNSASGMQQPLGFEANPVDRGFFDAYGVVPVSGEVFRDEQSGNDIVLSISAASALGFATPEEAIDATVSMTSGEGLVPFTVIGVVPDVPMKSIQGSPERLVFTHVGDRARFLSARVEPGRTGDFRTQMERRWEAFSADPPVTLSLRERLEDLYSPLSRTFLFFGGLAATALFIAALGISATASFSTERRHKEMGLRRAMGASRLNVTGELLSSIISPLLVACAAAVPLAALAGNGWLAGFAQRVPLTAAPFVIAVVLVLVIALAAAGLQILPVIGRTPAEALRRD